jgi:hypothetical protein
MGAWSTLPFGNDDAAEWAYNLEDADDLGPVEEALARVLATGSEYLESPEANEALAAIEILACLGGNPGDTETYTEAADAWVGRTTVTPPSELVDQAQVVIDRIVGDNSELRELWEDSDEYEQWLATVADLRARVAA